MDRLFDSYPGEATLSQEEFVSLLEAHATELFRRVHVLLGTAEFVEDAVQQTMVEALSCWRRYDRSRPLGPWLTGIALNVARRYWRRARVARGAAATFASAAERGLGPTPESDALSRERARLLYEALDRLSPILRETFLLRAVEDLPAEDVARLTGATTGAVHTRVSRARDAIRAYLDGRFGTEGAS
ncbi:MAG: sigma-70 family RNA polymerase sigma factor [Deltaproteobacteria bacterium]|nr:sigma-70 family RNA polymerase sigma factor [Deltaproteobacteria bacterium]